MKLSQRTISRFLLSSFTFVTHPLSRAQRPHVQINNHDGTWKATCIFNKLLALRMFTAQNCTILTSCTLQFFVIRNDSYRFSILHENKASVDYISERDTVQHCMLTTTNASTSDYCP